MDEAKNIELNGCIAKCPDCGKHMSIKEIKEISDANTNRSTMISWECHVCKAGMVTQR